MEQRVNQKSSRFGGYLKQLRESKRFSLDTVAELSSRYPERLTKSHLSRIENGQALPTVPRLLTLGQIYGISLASLADRYEIEVKRDGSAATSDMSVDALEEKARELLKSGLKLEALEYYEAILHKKREAGEDTIHFEIHKAQCLIQAEHYRAGKEEVEDLLSRDLTEQQQIQLNMLLAISCYRLSKYTIAIMSVEQVDKILKHSTEEYLTEQAHLENLRGNAFRCLARTEDALTAFQKAKKLFESISDHYEICKLTLNVGSTLYELGKVKHAKEAILKSLKVAEQFNYKKLTSSALSNLAEIAFKEGEYDHAEGYALRSNKYARTVGYSTVIFRNSFYLWQIATLRKKDRDVASHLKTLHCYFGRVESDLPEALTFQQILAGGE